MHWCQCMLLLGALASPLTAQAVKRLPLKAPERLDAEFISILDVRELADGAVLIADARDNALWYARFGTRPVAVARRGRGPLEYGHVGALITLAGDSTMMFDGGNLRILLLSGSRPVATLSSQHSAVLAVHGRPLGGDSLGHLLARTQRRAPAGAPVFDRPSSDSAVVELYDRRRGTVDTIARTRPRPTRSVRTFDDTGGIKTSTMQRLQPGARGEEVALQPDGWLAVVRIEPFRVDWRRPSGTWVKGAPLPVAGERIESADRAMYENLATQARRDAINLGLAPPPVIPPAVGSIRHPWEGRAPSAAPDGRLLILRSSGSSTPMTRYLVVNRSGGLDGEIHLPKGSLVVGAGRGWLYVHRKDDEDFDRLYRYPWP